jgi:hypothetical protein
LASNESDYFVFALEAVEEEWQIELVIELL